MTMQTPRKVYIIDDELYIRNLISHYLEADKRFTICGEADRVNSAVADIPKLSPDLVFLDVELIDGNGFDILEALEEVNFKIIFISAFENYALDAFHYQAAHYLLKPIEETQFKKALDRVFDQLNNTSAGLASMLLNMQHQEKQRFIVSSNEGFKVLKYENVVWAGSDGAYTSFYLSNGQKLLSSKPLKFYDESLPASHFFRIHRSYLININHVLEFRGKGQRFVKLTDGSELDVAGNRIEALRQYFEFN